MPTEFIGYSNPLWGLLFKTLFTLFPRVPWYGLILLAIQVLSLEALFYALSLTSQPRFKAFFFLLTFLGVFSNFFVSVQYTVTAILAAQCAFFLWLSLWQNGRLSRHRAAWWLAGLLLVTASLIRWDGLLIASLCALPLLVYAWLTADPLSRRDLLGRKFCLVLPALLIVLGAFFNHYWYEKTPGWNEFNHFDHERLELQDYRIDPYTSKTKPCFDAVGWTENDYHLFKDWYFMDKNIYDRDKMQRLAECFPRFGSEGKPVSYHSPVEILTSSGPQTTLMYFLVFLLLVPLKPARFVFFQLGWVFAVLTLLIYAFRAPDQVVLPLLTIPLNAAMYFSDPKPIHSQARDRKKRQVLLRIGLAFLGLFFILGLHSYRLTYLANQKAQTREKSMDACLAALNPQDGHLYVTWDSAFPYEFFNTFDNFDVFRKFHLFTLAVYQRCPNAQKMLDHFGIKELFFDLVDNPDVSLICSPQEGAMYRQYMWEKHHMEIYPEKTFECPFFKVFRIYSKPPSFRRKT